MFLNMISLYVLYVLYMNLMKICLYHVSNQIFNTGISCFYFLRSKLLPWNSPIQKIKVYLWCVKGKLTSVMIGSLACIINLNFLWFLYNNFTINVSIMRKCIFLYIHCTFEEFQKPREIVHCTWHILITKNVFIDIICQV